MLRLGAEFSADKKFRYRLWRIWREDLPQVTWILLNPSTADHLKDDPTIKRCIGFSMNMGYGGCEILNIFALRSTYPGTLLQVEDPVGPANDLTLLHRITINPLVICAWGRVHEKLAWRPASVMSLLKPFKPWLHCLKTCADGSPAHPLYLSSKLRPIQWPRP
jgi:hypothetical protein